MKIVHLGNGTWPDVTIDGAEVTVAGLALDTVALQEDAPVTLSICDHEATVSVQSPPAGRYVAVIDIPARVYIQEPVLDGGEPVLDDFGNPVYERVAQDLDPDSVRVAVWPQGGES